MNAKATDRGIKITLKLRLQKYTGENIVLKIF